MLARRWLANQIIAKIPLSRLEHVLQIEDVIDISADAQIHSHGYFDGDLLKSMTRTDDYSTAGYDGLTGGAEGGRIRLGIIEPDAEVNCEHKGFHEYLGGPSRFKHAGSCTSLSCYYLGYMGACTTSSTYKHGTVVSFAAAGSIEGGQDVNYIFSPSLARRRRGGITKQSELYYKGVSNTCSVGNAIEWMVENGIDVINMSFGVDSEGTCTKTYNSCGMNSILFSASMAGTALVASAGNSGAVTSGTCNVDYPANREDVVSVAALTGTWEEPITDYRLTTRWGGSSSGYLEGNYFNASGTARVDLVDIMAPGNLKYWYKGLNDYSTSQSGPATSWAAPVVSGIAGLVRERLVDIGWTHTTGVIVAMLMLYGDGYHGSTSPHGYNLYTVSDRGGFGRVRATLSTTPSLGSPRYQTSRTKLMTNSEVYEWPSKRSEGSRWNAV